MAENGMSADDAQLAALGYKQVLNRSWRKFTNAAVTISASSVLLSIPASFAIGLTYGGPALMIWGWIFVSICCICVAAGMAELASAYPTSGGMYYYVFQLLGPKYGPFVCWVNGWMNLLGQISSLASTHYFCATLLQTYILLATGTAKPPDGAPPPPAAPGTEVSPSDDYEAGPGFTWDAKQTLGLYAALLVFSATINSFPPRILGYLTEMGGFWHIVGVLICIVAVPIIATEHQSAEWVFTKFYSDLGNEYGITNKVYIAVIGLLLPAYAYTGYDGPAHMAEESHNPSIANPRGIMIGVFFMAVAGWTWIISLLFCTSDRLYILGESDVTPEADGDPIPQIFWDAFAQRTGNGVRSLGMLIIPLVGVFFCSISTLTYISRIMFAYSRDRAVPLSCLWIKLAPNQVPVFAVWGAAILAFIIATPSVRNPLAFNAILSLSTIALNIAYVTPNFIRITFGRNRFKPGPWNLGKWTYPINIIGTLWVAFATVIFSLPTEYPVDSNTNMNYAGVVLLIVLAISLIWYWFPFIGAYKWFKGPVNEMLPSEEEFVSAVEKNLDSSTPSKPLEDDPSATTAKAALTRPPLAS